MPSVSTPRDFGASPTRMSSAAEQEDASPNSLEMVQTDPKETGGNQGIDASTTGEGDHLLEVGGGPL